MDVMNINAIIEAIRLMWLLIVLIVVDTIYKFLNKYYYLQVHAFLDLYVNSI